MIEKLYETLILIDDVERMLKNIDDVDIKKYISPLEQLRRYIPLTRLHQPNNAVQINDFNLQSLEFTSDLLARYHVEKTIEENQLEEILTDIIDLYKQIEISNLDKKLKVILLDLLETIRRSIHEYKIRGIETLKESVARIIGTLVLNQDIIKDSKSEEVEKFSRIVDKFISTYSFAADTIQLLEAGSKYLPLLLVAAEKVSK